ncbi:MAG: LytR/AlgR family response regulator transcription factor [Burkholderiales bacterium]|jgi:DNA-binding LytR/AlgR family response regulator|nr:response regulator transcription factor [Rhodocyclaceae bacterium]MCE2722489.1 LytTR family DNA-binding domain-containing protein [Betaproteobacteria bacterium]MCA3023071.1 response regulator transcription factor [Rhodocyclaceae bacterium]MCA3043274.1 response regulator transcription factor [Rhodocyclaceae bacterium]MCA3052504.1 response regulator transcription factor [Rhodocyclaceae bacterium]
MNLTAIIAEDEPILRAQLKTKLAKLWPDLTIVADVGDGEAALEAIAEHQPQLAFLDIQMPEMTGIEVARSLAANKTLKCHIVFVTAFDQYAIDAFNTGAIDYVLKPYSDDRLQAAVERLKERLSAVPVQPQNLDSLMQQLAAKFNPTAEKLKWIKANIGSALRLIPIDEVLFFQSDEKYTLVATKEFDALIKTPIKDILTGIDLDKFWQIHRSTIVQAAAIDAVTRDFRGQATVKVKGRKENLTVSRPFSHLFKQM